MGPYPFLVFADGYRRWLGRTRLPCLPTTNMEDIRARISKDSTGAVDRERNEDKATGGSHSKVAARGRRPLPTFRGLAHRVAKSLHRFYIENEKGQRPVLRAPRGHQIIAWRWGPLGWLLFQVRPMVNFAIRKWPEYAMSVCGSK